MLNTKQTLSFEYFIEDPENPFSVSYASTAGFALNGGGGGGGLVNLIDSSANVINSGSGTGYFQWDNIQINTSEIRNPVSDEDITVYVRQGEGNYVAFVFDSAGGEFRGDVAGQNLGTDIVPWGTLFADRIDLSLTTGDINTPNDGQIWYNNTTGKFRAYENGTAVDIISSGGSYTFQDGIVDNAGDVGLGGSLTQNITIDMQGNRFWVTDNTNTSGLLMWENGVTNIFYDDLGDVTQLDVRSNSISMTAVGLTFELNATANTATITTPGASLEYAFDYSGNYTNRSLVDKEYVDSVAGGGFADTTLTADVTIDGDTNTYSVDFDNLNLFRVETSSTMSLYSNSSIYIGNNAIDTYVTVDTTMGEVNLTSQTSQLFSIGSTLRISINGNLGDPGDILTSDGTYTTWQPAGGGGGWTLDGTTTLENNVTINADGNTLSFTSAAMGTSTIDVQSNGISISFNDTASRSFIMDDTEMRIRRSQSGTVSTVEWQSSGLSVNVNDGTNYGAFDIDTTTATSAQFTGSTYTTKFDITESTFIFSSTDTLFEGLKYNIDYSANFTNRSLVDKEYVDTAVSDIRLKENIVSINNGLSIINQLKPVEFDFINTKEHKIGFIAQDVQEILPHLVVKSENDVLKLKESQIVPYLVKAIQELSNKVFELETKISELKK